MSAKTAEALGYLDDKLKIVVTEALAKVMSEKPDNPMHQLASLIKKQSLTYSEVSPPIKVSVPTVAPASQSLLHNSTNNGNNSNNNTKGAANDPNKIISVELTNVAPKSELVLNKSMLYGLHMPNEKQWLRMLDYITSEMSSNSGGSHPNGDTNKNKIIMIVETEDSGKDLIFIDGVPYYGDLSEKRAERRRRLLREGALSSLNMSRLEQSVVGGGVRRVPSGTQKASEWLRNGFSTAAGETNSGATTTVRRRGASTVVVMGDDDPHGAAHNNNGLGDTQRPMRAGSLPVSEGASAANAGQAASSFQRTLSDVVGSGGAAGGGGRRRARSLRDVSSFEALKTALAEFAASISPSLSPASTDKISPVIGSPHKKMTTVRYVEDSPTEPSSPKALYSCASLSEVISRLKPADSTATVECHIVNPTENMSNPVAMYERIDTILGLSDRDDVPPVLVVSFRSRESDWRRLLSVVNATQKPLIEFKRLRETAMIEATSTHKRFTMTAESNEVYWSSVAKRRIERDAKRRAVALAREEVLAKHKAERMAEAIAERAEAAAAAAAAANSTVSGAANTATVLMTSTFGGGLGSTYSGGVLTPRPPSSTSAAVGKEKEIVLQPDEFEMQHVAETQRRARIDAARERRRQREDVIFDRLCESERAKKAVKLQALIRGYLARRIARQQSIMESTSGVFINRGFGGGGGGGEGGGEGAADGEATASEARRGSSSSLGRRPSGIVMGIDGSTKIDAPALMRRVYLKANESMAGLLTPKAPLPKPSAVRHEFWVPRRVHVVPQYNGDVSSDEEFFDQHTVMVPPRSETRRPVLFNALLRLQEVAREVGDDLYEWAITVQKQFVGVSTLQQRSYDALKTAALDLIHIVFLEAHHRRLYSQSTLRPTSTFSDYIEADFFELTSWFSFPHFMSLSTAPGVATALQYGPQNPMYDHVLYASGDPQTLPWGGEAPPDPVKSGDHKLFMPHWSENAHQLVSTTVDFTSARVFQKQIEYATITGVPCWWFSVCPHLGVYVNNQPFVAVRRPIRQEIEGVGMFDQLHTSIKDTPMLRGGGGVSPSNIPLTPGGQPLHPLPGTRPSSPLVTTRGGARRLSDSPSPSQSVLVPSSSTPFGRTLAAGGADTTAGAASFKIDGGASVLQGENENSPTQRRAVDAMTFTYSEGVSIRLRTWFGVHWTEMERKFRNRVASLAANNKYHIPAFVAKPLSSDGSPTTTIEAFMREKERSKRKEAAANGGGGGGEVDNLSLSSEESRVRPYDETSALSPSSGDSYKRDFGWLDDTHKFTGVPCFTDSAAAPAVVQTLTNMIPPPPPPPPRPEGVDINEASTRRRTYSRNNTSVRKRGGSTLDAARSMRRLQSVTSMRIGGTASSGGGGGGAASRAPSVLGDGTTRTLFDDTRLTLGGTEIGGRSVLGSTSIGLYSPDNVLQRVRTANKVAEKLFKHPQSRYIRTPGLEVSGYQWWCNLDQFISLVHKGLKKKASVVIGITSESQVFYSLVAQLVAHACYASEDEIFKIFKMEQSKLKEEAERLKREAAEVKQRNFDPDNLGLLNSGGAVTSGNSTKAPLRSDPDDFGDGCSTISSIMDSEDEDHYVTAQEMLGLGAKDTSVDVSFSNVGAGLALGSFALRSGDAGGSNASPHPHSPLAFLDMFAMLCEVVCGDRTEAAKAWGAFNHFVRLGAGTYFITSLTRDIELAERAETMREVRQRITNACRTSERYASLFLTYLFLRSLPPGEGTDETPSFVAWLSNPKHAKMMEWLKFIDPWAHCPARSPDPHHTRYSSVYRRWTENGFITSIH